MSEPQNSATFDVTQGRYFRLSCRNYTPRGTIVEFSPDASGACSGFVDIFQGDAVGGSPWLTISAKQIRTFLGPSMPSITAVPRAGATGLLTISLTEEPQSISVAELAEPDGGAAVPDDGTISLAFSGVSGAANNYIVNISTDDQRDLAIATNNPGAALNAADFANMIFGDFMASPVFVNVTLPFNGGVDTTIAGIGSPAMPVTLTIIEVIPVGGAASTIRINGKLGPVWRFTIPRLLIP